MAETSTLEALIVELLGDVGKLHDEVKALPHAFTNIKAELAANTATLNAAGDRYRMTITAFTEQAKAEVTNYLEWKTGLVVAQTMEEQRAALQQAAREAFKNVANGVAAEVKRSNAMRMAEHGITALLAASVASGLVHWLR